MSNTKHEDAIMKMGFKYFRDHILKTLGIDYDYLETGPTELIQLTIHSLFMDFTFLTTKDLYIHVEFQTTDAGEEDLRRFHAYEGVFSHETGKKVITYVIYSGGITHTRDTLDCGGYEYKVFPIYLARKSADEVFQYLQKKKEAGELLCDEDFAQLSLTPLMASSQSKKEVIKQALQFVKQGKQDTAEKTLAILYALADKFLKESDLEEVKEVVAMTRLGQMLYDDGMKAGVEAGRMEGLALGRTEGLELGRTEGLELGRTEGLELGRADGLKAGRDECRKDMIREMLLDHQDYALIKKYTGAADEEIQQLEMELTVK